MTIDWVDIAITEWLGSIGDFKSAAGNLSAGVVLPAPGVLPVFGLAMLMSGKSRRRK